MSEPNPAQALILWCLLARHGRVPQGEILPAVKKADREALATAGLITVEKRGRSFVLAVTDRGWHWAGAHLDAALPPTFRVMQDWLARLGRHLDATGQTLADFIGAPPEPPEALPEAGKTKPGEAKAGKTKAGKTKAGETKASKSKPADGASAKAAAPRPKAAASPPRARKLGVGALRARIEDAYLALTGGARAKAVRFSDLRAQLAELDRATVDAGLARILKGDKTARLSQLSDPKALTQAERDAAYSPAGEPFHLLWIQA